MAFINPRHFVHQVGKLFDMELVDLLVGVQFFLVLLMVRNAVKDCVLDSFQKTELHVGNIPVENQSADPCFVHLPGKK